MEAYVSAVAWISRGYARRLPRDHQPTNQQYEQLKTQVAEMGMQEQHKQQQIKNDQYPEQIQQLSDQELQNFVIKQSDALIAAAKVQNEFSSIQVYIYQQEKNNLYVHHEHQLSAYPLALQWVGYRFAKKTNLLFVGTFLPQIQLWDLDSLNEVQPLAILGGHQNISTKKVRRFKEKKRLKSNSHQQAVSSLSLNRKSYSILASGSADWTTKVWDIEKLQCVQTFKHNKDRIQVVQWNPQQKQALLTVTSNGFINVFDARNPKASVSTKIDMQVQCSKWNPYNTSHLAISGQDGFIGLFDARKLAQPIFYFKAHQKQASALDFTYNNILITCGFDGYIKVWDCLTKTLIAAQNAKVGKLFSIACYQDDRNVLAAGNQQGELYVWDMQQNKDIYQRICHK